MDTPESNTGLTLQQYHAEIVEMMEKVENWKKELASLNEGLLEASRTTCSEYGDRTLESMQSKLFYLQRVLSRNTLALQKYKDSLVDALKTAVNKNIDQFEEYQQYCHKSAQKITEKLQKYKNKTLAFIERNCGTN